MKKQKSFYLSFIFLSSFIVWTILVMYVDVKGIGPMASKVGFSTINNYIRNLTGTNMWLYFMTDWLSAIPIGIIGWFGFTGFIQLVKRKNLFKVDFDILMLGVFYIAVLMIYIFFERFIINYRPVLIEGILEASYPSSTTLLVMFVMLTALIQIKRRISTEHMRNICSTLIIAFTIFMVVGRIISGVHWITDIIGGMLLSIGLVELYHNIIN